MTNRRLFTQLAATGALGLAAGALLPQRAFARGAGVTAEQATAWLAAYGKAWEERSSDQIVTIFTPDAVYREAAFADPFVGHDAIRAYWDGAVAAQSDIEFTSELWAVTENVAIAHWATTFNAGGAPAKLDGVFHLTFADTSGDLPIASQLLEWWFFAAG